MFFSPRFLARVQLCFLCAVTLLVSSPALGQGTGTLSGVVTDSDGVAIFGAVVSVGSTSVASRTDERGGFRLTGVPAGPVEIRARRLGFGPGTRAATLTAGENNGRINFTLAALPALLDQVTVQRTRVKYTGRLAGYYQRLEQRSGGQFVTREEIDRDESRSLSQLLSRSPGVSSVRLRSGGGAVRLRGRSCRPLVWIDGVPMPAGEVELDAFPINTLHGIELYLGSTSAPMEYTAQQNRSSCGSILLWSRGRDTEARPSARSQSVDLEALVASLAVYTSDQVDKRAELRSQAQLEAAYPPELYATRASGSVTAEFVVDTDGRIEPGTLLVVSSTHSLLRSAVAMALTQSQFAPALKDGKPVRQFVRQRFDFGPKSVGAAVR